MEVRTKEAAQVPELATYEPMTKQEAQDITRAIAQRTEELWDLIVLAYHRQAWKPMGYRNWDSYCKSEFAGARLRLPSEERAEVAASLRDHGLSSRAIAAATGSSDRTVRRDTTGAANAAPGPGQRAAKGERPANGEEAGVAATPIRGLDGKTYPAPPPPGKQGQPKSTSAQDGQSQPKDVSALQPEESSQPSRQGGEPTCEPFNHFKHLAHELLRFEQEHAAQASWAASPYQLQLIRSRLKRVAQIMEREYPG